PNTEVKRSSGDNSRACPCQDSSLPAFDPFGSFFSFFFVFAMLYLILIGNIEINKMLSQNGELEMKKLLVFGLTAMMIIAIGAIFVFVMLY
ncbi:MAG: hypothetical protein HFF02_05185, partial [Erysipelotrichaceae bacterium]|nr:hypothetical protein [Erysipelotrichaceae bacterium]